MNADPPLPHTASAAPSRPDAGVAGPGPADIGEGLREAFQAVMEEPVPPVLSMLAAELQRRLESQVGETAAEGRTGEAEQTPT
jgi:hypothetical protein